MSRLEAQNHNRLHKLKQGGGVQNKSCTYLALEFVHEVVDKTVVKVLTTEVSITSSGLNLEDALLNGKERHIESTTTQVEDEHIALTLSLLVKTVGDGSGSGLVDDAEDIETGNETGILGSLTLGVVEVGGDGDDGVVDGASEVGLCGLTHLGKDHGGDLLRCEVLLLALELNLDDRLAGLLDNGEGEVLHVGLDLSILELAANKTLGIEDCVGGVHGDLVLCGVSDETLSVGEGNEGRGRPVTLVVGDNLDAVITEDTNARVRGSEIDTYSGSHSCVFRRKRGVSQRRKEMMECSRSRFD